MNDRDRLAAFHRTISEQLNARLAESPRFFWALVVVSTGYGYVLWQANSDPVQAQSRKFIVLLASVLSYITVLWASWYLAALGYAFRFLQNCQHCIERALGWHRYAPEPAEPPRISLCNLCWLLPSIYHAHVFGLCAFLTMVIAASYWLWRGNAYAILTHVAALVFGLAWILFFNGYYLWRFKRRERNPNTVSPLIS